MLANLWSEIGTDEVNTILGISSADKVMGLDSNGIHDYLYSLLNNWNFIVVNS